MKNLLALILIILSVVILAGCITTSNTPEGVLRTEAQYIESGDYNKLLDLYVKPNSIEPYSPQERDVFIKTALAMTELRGKPKLLEFKIINETKISQDKVLITTYTKYKWETETKPEEKTSTRTLVRVDGNWKIQEKLPGFETILSIIMLLSVYTLRKYTKKEKKEMTR